MLRRYELLTRKTFTSSYIKQLDPWAMKLDGEHDGVDDQVEDLSAGPALGFSI